MLTADAKCNPTRGCGGGGATRHRFRGTNPTETDPPHYPCFQNHDILFTI